MIKLIVVIQYKDPSRLCMHEVSQIQRRTLLQGAVKLLSGSQELYRSLSVCKHRILRLDIHMEFWFTGAFSS